MANFLYIMNSTGTCSWRVYPIANALTKEGHQVMTLNLPQVTEDQYNLILQWTDVLTFQMVCAKELVERAKQKGIFTIFDSDDLIDEVPPQHPSFKEVQKQDYKRMFKKILQDVDLITVSTDPLYEKYKGFGEIIKIENYLSDDVWERPYSPNAGKTLRIGWAGGISHQEDFDYIAPVMSKVIKDCPNTKFCYTGGGGWDTKNPDSIYKFEKDHFRNIPLNRREFSFGAKVEMWPDKLNSMRLDVALAPLDENNFSRCKSQIKYYEYAINHWPGVFQKFLYKNKVKHGETGFLADTPEEWEKYLKLLINNGRLRKEMGERAYTDVKNKWTFSGNKEKWLEVYRSASQRSTHRNQEFYIASK